MDAGADRQYLAPGGRKAVQGVLVERRTTIRAGRCLSAGATALLPHSSLDEDAWEDLLSFIEERRVIPIIGPELLLVETDQGPRLLYDWLAEKLARRLNVDISQLPQPYTLNDVVCWFLGARGRREEAYVRLRGIIKDAAFEPPLALRQPRRDPRIRPVRHDHLRPAARDARSTWSGSAAPPAPRCSPTRPIASPTCRPSATACSGRSCITCSAGSPLRRTTSSPTRTCWSSSARCRASTWRRRSCSTNSSTTTSSSSAATSRTGWRACSCAWRSASACRTRATSARCWPTTTAARTSASCRSCSRSASAPASTPAPARFVHELHERLSARRKPAAGAGWRQRRGAHPPARARDAGQRRVHQLRTRGPRGRAAAQGGARGRGRHDLVRHGTARERRRLRPQDPAQHRALLLFHPGRLRGDAAPARSVFPPRVELRDRPRRATWPTARCSSCR